jgi:broad specificity phosphatase PhoE
LSASVQIYLIRHGQTAWSLTGQHTGRTDLALTAQGEAEARALAAPLKDLQFGVVLSSPALRAQRTCELAGLASGRELDADLREWDYGDYEGRTSAEIERERPDWSLWRDGCPNGESPVQVAARADRLLVRLGAMQGRVALFSHGHFSAAVAVRWIRLPVVNGEHFPLRPVGIGILGSPASHPQVPAVLTWNGDALASRP